ncbi:MAG: hypothetical protein NVSMB46_06150 [Candidatus Saccharimonadales bacterium]
MKKNIGLTIIFIIIGAVLFGAAFLKNKPSYKVSVSPTTKTYVSLGDSVAAGVGLADYTDSSACNRTRQSYPYILAAQRNLQLNDFSCSGATAQSGIEGSQDVNKLSVASQLDQLFSVKTPDLITITIGANDVQWTTLLAQCYAHDCGSTADTEVVDNHLAMLAESIHTIIQKLMTYYGASLPPTEFSGYYQLLPPRLMNCNEMRGLSDMKLQWERLQQDKLNATIKDAVSGNQGIRFMPINFSGHELCTADPWIQGLGAKAPFHPNDIGQQQIAKDL